MRRFTSGSARAVLRRRLLSAVAAGFVIAGAAFGGWDGTQPIRLGDRAASAFSGTTPFQEVHAYRFFAPAGTKVSAAVKTARGSDLAVATRLAGPAGETVGIPAAGRLATTVLDEAGEYVLEVSRAAGGGTYTLTTRGLYPKKLGARRTAGRFEFGAAAGTKLTARLSAVRGGGASAPLLASLTGPAGDVALPPGSTDRFAKLELAAEGMYTLTWNQTGAGPVDVVLGLAAPASKALVSNPDGQSAQAMGAVEGGDPLGAPSAGYTGSDACRPCHAEHYDRVTRTLHNSKLRSTSRAGAAGYAVATEADAAFRAAGGTDLTTLPAFAGYQGVRLSYVAGDALPYKVTVGTTTYDVQYVMGGNGVWKQRYVVKVGQSHYTAPVQWNEVEKTWSAYNAGDWFNADKTPKTIAKNKAWELKCAGCHATGVAVRYDGASGEYTAGYAQLNIGCEACHGPGSAHVADATARAGTNDLALWKIVNPRRLLQVRTPEAVKLAGLACGQCHHRGTGDKPAGAPDKTEYPWKAGIGLYRLGYDDFTQFYTTTGAASFHGYKDNPMGTATPTDLTDDTWVASKQHHQQYLDQQMGPHAQDQVGAAVCFDCHDPHGNGVDHQIRTRIEKPGAVFQGISASNNSLCLTCHAGSGDFANVTQGDIETLQSGTAPAAVVASVVDHMKDRAAMPVATAAYDAAGATQVGNCVRCHMPASGFSATLTGTDRAGNKVGDVKAHTFLPVWPNVSRLLAGAMTNSCETCHPTAASDTVGTVIAEWAVNPDAVAEGSSPTFHADVPRNTQNSVANAARDGGVACAACHTTEGFVRIQVDGSLHDLTAAGDQSARDTIVRSALMRNEGITCRACHGKQTDGTYAAGANPLRFPKDQLCQKCHNNETVTYDDWVADGEILRHPADQMLRGVAGAQVPGQTYGASAHPAAFDSCVECHMSPADGGGHGFDARWATCTPCHGGPAPFDVKNAQTADWDGDAAIEGVQSEVTGCLDRLRTAITAAVPSVPGTTVTWDGSRYFLIGNATTTAASGNSYLLDATADAPLLRAIFNYYFVNHDKSKGVHNAVYAVQLLQKSYRELTGTDMSAALR